MSNTFKFVGKIKKLKSNAYHTKTFESGWVTEDYSFAMQCGTDSQILRISSGKFENDEKNFVYTYSKAIGDKKGEQLKIDWTDRKDPEVVDSVAVYKRYTVDMISAEDRDAIKERDEEEYKASLQSKKEYIHSYDFLHRVMKLVDEGHLQDDVYVVAGDVEITYSFKDDRYYRAFVPTKIYKANKNAEEGCTGCFELFLDNDAFKNSETSDDCIVKSYVQYYASSEKKQLFAPIEFTIKSDNPKLEGIKKIVKSRLPEKDSVCRFGLTVYFKNGAEKEVVSKETLTEDQKEMIELGLITLEEIQNSTKGVYGERITQNIILDISRGYTSGPVETSYKTSDFKVKPNSNGKKETSKSKAKNVIDDMDDEDII